jgi:putative nucleotidyltransferase with HDIG domain
VIASELLEEDVISHRGDATAPDRFRLIEATEIRFSEIIGALSVALDITQGHPQGHCMRTALIGMRLAEELKLPTPDCSALFYALLLKDLGCSSNAAKMAYLFGADDQAVKHSSRMIDWTKPGQCLKHCWNNCAPEGSPVEKLLKVAAIVRMGPEGGRRISEIRCERGAEIARMLQLPEASAQAILDLDENWNGKGTPYGTKGSHISLLGRICCLAQTVEVFYAAHGQESALEMARQRRGKWFDPALVDALFSSRRDGEFWQRLQSRDLMAELGRWEPEDAVLLADEACLDRVAEAFARVVDAKSPWTYQHSTRVAQIAVGVSQQFGCTPELERDLRRAALLHDIGKLGVSNLILDKPSKPSDDEFRQIRKHPEYSQRILQQVGAFHLLAEVASAHHERLDGRGYHRGLAGGDISFSTRVLTIADICEAMSAQRPYREAMDWGQIQQILAKDVGRGIDQDCLVAVRQWHDGHELQSRVEMQLQEVDRLLSEL